MPDQPPYRSDLHRLVVTFLFGAMTGMASTGALVMRSPWWLVSVAVALPGWVWHLRLARRLAASTAPEVTRG